MHKPKGLRLVCTTWMVGFLVLCLALSARPTASQGCIDSDLDGTTTCQGDCNDQDPDKNRRDFDGDGVTSCDGDCEDYDPSISHCHIFSAEVPDYTYWPEQSCYRVFQDITWYQCPSPQTPSDPFNNCTVTNTFHLWSAPVCFGS